MAEMLRRTLNFSLGLCTALTFAVLPACGSSADDPGATDDSDGSGLPSSGGPSSGMDSETEEDSSDTSGSDGPCPDDGCLDLAPGSSGQDGGEGTTGE
jgi:hypothetical protein